MKRPDIPKLRKATQSLANPMMAMFIQYTGSNTCISQNQHYLQGNAS